MSVLKQKGKVPQVGRIRHPQSHTGLPVSLMDSGGGKGTTNRIEKRKENKNKLHIATYNIRSMAKDEKIYELEEELTKIKWDIVGLSEVKRRGEHSIELQSGNQLYYRGPENETYGGIGFIIKKTIKRNIKTFKAISDRVGYIIVEINKKLKMKLIQVYAPTSDHDDNELEIFYEDITNAIEETPTKLTIVMGDFNSKIGKKADEIDDKVGKYGYGIRNSRGETLINYLQQQDLYAVNTFFNKKDSRKWTWISPNGETKNEIDYFLCKNKQIFEDVTALNRFTTGSDHRMLRARIRINNKLERKQRYKNLAIIDQNKLREKGEEFRKILGETKPPKEEIDLDRTNNNISKQLVTAAIRVAKKEKTKENKISQETKKLMDKRRIVLHEGKRNTVEYAEINKTIRKRIKEDLRRYNENKIEKVIEQNRGSKCLKPSLGKPKIICIKDQNGEEQRDINEITATVETFYNNLYATKIKPDADEEKTIQQKIMNVNSEEIPEIESYEIEAALSQLKNNKAPGPDGVVAEMLKEGKDEIIERLKVLFNHCLQEGEIPDNWNASMVILLFKKGNKNNLENYRPISLLSQIYKLFMRIITNRLTPKLDAYQGIEQAGFRKGYSTSDHLLTMRTLIEKANEYQLNLYLAFIDYEKAFDSVELWAVERAMNNCRIDSRYRTLIHNIYEKANMTVQLGRDTTKPIPLKRGVRQGDVISPKLFTLAMEDMFKQLQWSNKGININGRKLNHLRYADDIVLITTDFEELQDMVRQLSEESKQIGLKINMTKTKIMTNTSDLRQISLNDVNLETVNEYIYLGQVLKINKENQTAEIMRRVRLAWAGFGKLKGVLINKKIPQYLRTRVFDQCVLPILTYGSQTWTLTRANMDKIAKAQRSMERIMIGVKLLDKKPNTWIRQITKVEDARERVARLKWDFAGHNARQPDQRWNAVIQRWRPWLGKRSRGRPQMRWGDDLKRVGGLHWARHAQDRDTWKSLKEAYVQSWTT